MSTTAVAPRFTYAAATAEPAAGGYPGTYFLGHSDPGCRHITKSRLAPFDPNDGDIWPCATCIDAKATTNVVSQFEDARPLPTGDGSGGGLTVVGASDRQVAFFDKLLAEREHKLTPEQIAAAKASTRKCSAAIDKLLTAPKTVAAATAPKELRPNRFAGTCTECGNSVPEGEGFIRQANGKWLTAHKPGTCPPAAPKVEAPKPGELPTLPDGIVLETNRVYVNADGKFVRVVKARQSVGFYGKIWDGHDWAYAGHKALRNLVRPITAEEAAAFGHAEHHCCFCGIELTDEGEGRSVEVGYGPHCARKNGLPWGTKG